MAQYLSHDQYRAPGVWLVCGSSRVWETRLKKKPMVEIAVHESVQIPAGKVVLDGELHLPEHAMSLVIFSHGSGSSRLSPRNQLVARHLRSQMIGTLLFDLLTDEEDKLSTRFNIELLTDRLINATEWVLDKDYSKDLKIGYFGASTGAASALNAAAKFRERIYSVVSRGGRPDLAMRSLQDVRAATLLIVGSLDEEVLKLNELAYAKLPGRKELAVVRGASHLFEEPGKLDIVAELASQWFSTT